MKSLLTLLVYSFLLQLNYCISIHNKYYFVKIKPNTFWQRAGLLSTIVSSSYLFTLSSFSFFVWIRLYFSTLWQEAALSKESDFIFRVSPFFPFLQCILQYPLAIGESKSSSSSLKDPWLNVIWSYFSDDLPHLAQPTWKHYMQSPEQHYLI